MNTGQIVQGLMNMRDGLPRGHDRDLLAEACFKLSELEDRTRKEPRDDNEDWTEHDGTGSPVDEATRVSVKFRSGLISRHATAFFHRTGRHDRWTWDATDVRPTDIIAYRVQP